MDYMNPANPISPLNPLNPISPLNFNNYGASDTVSRAKCIPEAANNMCQMTGFEVGAIVLLGLFLFGLIVWMFYEFLKD